MFRMPYKLTFSLLFIFLIFLFLEFSELTKIDYSEDKLNSTVLVGKLLNLKDEEYLHWTNEFDDISQIEQVSRKLKESETVDFGVKTKTLTGKNSIYVEALQSIAASKKISPKSLGVPFNIQDSATGNLIRPSTMLEAHIACGNEISKLPRVIVKEDRKVKFGSDFSEMFRKRYEKVFGYNLLIEENVSKQDNRNKIKRAEKRKTSI